VCSPLHDHNVLIHVQQHMNCRPIMTTVNCNH